MKEAVYMRQISDAEKLRLMRKQLGMTQDRFAKKIYVSRSAVTNYETGRKNIPGYVISKAEALIKECSG
jgi:transcriptional regulator with XRE-family HTH domain